MQHFEKAKQNKYFLKLQLQVKKFKSLDKKIQIVLILLFLLILLGVPSAFAYIKMSNQGEEVVVSEEIEEISPTPTPEEEITPTKAVYYSPTITKAVTSIKTPTPTTGSSNPTSVPTQTSDTTPPTLDYMTGPTDGSTIDFNNFCFPMKASDNVSSSNDIQTRYRFDGASFGDWGSNFAPCYSNVSNGSHNFVLEFRDKAGNVGSAVNRTFTVQVN